MYQTLKDLITNTITTNANEEITGAILNTVLDAIVDVLDSGYLFAGIANEETVPVNTDYKIVYLAMTNGNYINFNDIVLQDNKCALLKSDEVVGWVKEELNIPQWSHVMEVLENKVDKVEGKGLSQENYTTAEKQKLYELPTAEQINEAIEGKQDALTFDDVPQVNSQNPVKSDGIYRALLEKVDKIEGMGLSHEDYTAPEKQKLEELPTAEQIQQALNEKQDNLTFDDVPTEGSDNPVKSSGIKEIDDLIQLVTASALAEVNEKIGGILYAFEHGFSRIKVQELLVARKLEAYPVEGNLFLFGLGVPAIVPQFNGQMYFDATNGIWYKAGYNGTDPSASDWHQDTFAFDQEPTEDSNNVLPSGVIYTELGKKVDKVEGKGLSTNDYTDSEKEKLGELPTNTELENALSGKQDNLTFDNSPTEDSDNPVKSGGVFTSLSGKVDKINGKGLSTEDFTTAEKEKLANLPTNTNLQNALDGKVDKVSGKGLSTEDFTTSEKTKLDNLPDNSTLNGYLEGKVDKVEGKGLSTEDFTTAEKSKLGELPTNTELENSLNGKQNVLTFDETPTENSNNPVKSGGVYNVEQQTQYVSAAAFATLEEQVKGILDSIQNGFSRIIVQELMVARKFEAYPVSGNVYLTGDGAPSIVPQFNGQEYYDTTNNVWYKAGFTTTNPTSAAWKQITTS